MRRKRTQRPTIKLAMQAAIQDLEIRIRNILHLHIVVLVPRLFVIRSLGRGSVFDGCRTVDTLLLLSA